MDILAVSAFYHDSAACLVRDGTIVAAAQKEPFTRKKGDESFPALAIAYCLREGGVLPEELTAVAFYDKPLLKFERLASSVPSTRSGWPGPMRWDGSTPGFSSVWSTSSS